MSVEEFNNSFTSEMENLPELFSAYDQVYESLPVEDENYSFITFTLNTSLNELYAEEIGEKAALSGCLEKKSRPVTPLPGEENLPQQEEIYEFQLYAPYTIEHTILNPELLTVGERDRIIHTFQTELADYVDTLSEEDVTDSNIKQALTKKAAESAENLSTETIRLSCEFSGIEVLNLGQEDIIE